MQMLLCIGVLRAIGNALKCVDEVDASPHRPPAADQGLRSSDRRIGNRPCVVASRCAATVAMNSSFRRLDGHRRNDTTSCQIKHCWTGRSAKLVFTIPFPGPAMATDRNVSWRSCCVHRNAPPVTRSSRAMPQGFAIVHPGRRSARSALCDRHKASRSRLSSSARSPSSAAHPARSRVGTGALGTATPASPEQRRDPGMHARLDGRLCVAITSIGFSPLR